MSSNVRFAWVALLVGAGALGAACSSTKDSGTGTTTPAATVTQHISAAAGGTVADAAGTATLSIPGGALPADIDITLATTAAEAGTVSSVYNFGPEGTQFAKPASLVLKMPDGVTVPSGKTASLATYDGTKWAAIAGSTFAGGMVTGPVAHFSKFTIVLIDGQVSLQNSCSDVVTSFVGCGGDVTGSWTFTDWCVANTSLGADPTDGGCAGFSVVADVTPTGTIEFKSDGSYSQGVISIVQNVTETIPTSCMGTSACEGNTGLGGKSSTCVTSGATCVCTSSQTQDNPAKTGTYSVSGSNVTIDTGSPAEYCVKGNTLTVAGRAKVDSGIGPIQLAYVLTKQ